MEILTNWWDDVIISIYVINARKVSRMSKRIPTRRELREMERKEQQKKLDRTIARNWVICIGSLAIIVAAMFLTK